MLPALYFPTTIVCVDDDKLALDTYKALFKNNFNCVFFESGKEALDYIKDNQSNLSGLNFSSLVQDYDHKSSETLLKLDIAPLLNIYQTTKDNEISVLVTDYFMEPIDGLKLCQEVHKYPLKKFLLTEAHTQSLATNAFNNNTINYFLNKTDSPEMIIAGIDLLIKEFFIDVTLNLKHYFEVNHTPLTDSVFIDYFYKLFNSERIREYYLIDKNGSYLLIDSERKRKVLLVHTDMSLDALTASIEEIEEVQPAIEQLKKRTHLPFFGITENISYELAKSINTRLVPCHPLNGESKYYISLVDL